MKPKTEKQVQIPLRLLQDIDNILDSLMPYLASKLDKESNHYIKAVSSEIKEKFAKMERHDTFSAYKNSEKNTEIREYFRMKYLDESGIRTDWRTEKETEI